MGGVSCGSGWGGPRPATVDGGRPAPTREQRAWVALLLRTGEGGTADRWGQKVQCRVAVV
jgi:hypothetical protein